MVKQNSSKIQSVRRNAINIIDEQQLITDTESEIQKLKSKEYDLKKALSNIENNQKTFNIDVSPLYKHEHKKPDIHKSFKEVFQLQKN